MAAKNEVNMKFQKQKTLNNLLMGGFILSSLLLGSCGAKRDSKQATDISESDIVNGKAVTKNNGNAHFIVAIVADAGGRESLCTGSLVASNVVLTAAHCVNESPEKLRIVFGVDVKKTKEIRDADQFTQHPNWDRHMPSGEGDLALIHFKGELPTGFAPVKLANPDLKLKIGQKVLMMGYGVTDGETESGAGKLRQTGSVILEQRSPTEFVSDGKKSSVCFGDSGGPSFIKAGKEYIQWGVASSVFNQSCNEASIHTAVMNYDSWIKSTIDKMQH